MVLIELGEIRCHLLESILVEDVSECLDEAKALYDDLWLTLALGGRLVEGLRPDGLGRLYDPDGIADEGGGRA